MSCSYADATSMSCMRDSYRHWKKKRKRKKRRGYDKKENRFVLSYVNIHKKWKGSKKKMGVPVKAHSHIETEKKTLMQNELFAATQMQSYLC